MNRNEYIELFAGGKGEAVAFEERCLSIGRDLLPACALNVLNWMADGTYSTCIERTPGNDYYEWLASQLEA